MELKQKTGFTLIEMLVVVLIIGILAAIALPKYERAVIRSNFAALMPMVDGTAKAMEEKFLVSGDFTYSKDMMSIGYVAPEGASASKYKYGSRHINGKIIMVYGGLLKDGNVVMEYDIGLSNNGSAYENKKFCTIPIPQAGSIYDDVCKALTGKEVWDVYNSTNYFYQF